MSMTDTTPEAPRNGAAANLAALRDRAGKVTGAFDRKQRTMMAAVFAGTVGVVLAFSFLSSRTDWAPLMTNLSSDDASAITKQLEANGTEYQLADGGSTIEVPSDVVYQTRIDIAAVDMPSSGKVGYGILDNQDITSSEFTQRVGFQRAMEGELASTIEAIDGVTAATVHLAIPKNDTFALDEQKASASVMVKTSAGKTLAGRQVQAIVNLVAGGIEGLSPSDVTVADGEGNVLAAPGTSPGSGGSDAKEMQTAYEMSVAARVQEMLTSVVGPGKAKVTVSAVLDFDATSTTEETYSAPTTLVPGEALAVNETTKTETYTGDGSGAAAAGILGPDGLPLTSTTQGTTGTAGSGYELTERSRNNAVNKVIETTSKAPGSVVRQSIAVIIDEKAVDATQLPDLEKNITAAAGIDATRGDTVAVTRFALDTTAEKQAAEELAFRDKQAAAAAEAGIPVNIVAGAGGGLLFLMILFFLRSRKKKKKLRAEAEAGPLALGSGNSALAEQVITIDATPRRVGDPGDPTAVLAGVGAGAVGPGMAATAMGAAPSGDPGLERREVLGDLIDNQPDEVAQLLRSWLGDRREVTR